MKKGKDQLRITMTCQQTLFRLFLCLCSWQMRIQLLKDVLENVTMQSHTYFQDYALITDHLSGI